MTNYHMLFAHLAVRHSTGANLVLPGFDLLVLDEAHEAPSISRDFFGFAVSEHTLTRLAAAAASMGNVPLATVLRQEAAGLFRQLAAHRGEEATAALPAPSGDAKPVLDALERLRRHALTWADAVRGDRRALGTARMTVRHATTAAERLAAALEQPSPDKVTWLEADAKGRTVLLSKPADVSPTLRSLLFGSCESVSLVSATLTTAGTFDFFRRQVGAPDHVRELVAETPFRFREQALLVVPQGAPDPNTPEYLHHLSRVFDDVLEACGGRTLGLFTSYRALHAVRDHLAKSPWRILCQGDAPRTELVREFRQDVRSVLLGTESFWTGIDVAGEALTAVVIDKLPFPSPADPLIAALSQRDPRAFDTTLVPLAIIALRQGVGRLIRSKTDVGVVVIVDPRLADRRYGRRFLRSLPAMYSTRDLKNIRPFLEEATRARRD
ncbi:MAG: ATP-dependent DNA helicase [Myxococcales bacterium]|nr:ATP-dependent DNA helicase [Myxococcales bacterium]